VMECVPVEAFSTQSLSQGNRRQTLGEGWRDGPKANPIMPDLFRIAAASCIWSTNNRQAAMGVGVFGSIAGPRHLH
jgi:hypothetical protein